MTSLKLQYTNFCKLFLFDFEISRVCSVFRSPKWAFSITCCPLSVNFSFYSSQPLGQIKLNLDVIADILWMVLLLNYVGWPCSTSTSLIAAIAMSFTWLKLPKLCLLTLSIILYVWLSNFNCAELPYISDIQVIQYFNKITFRLMKYGSSLIFEIHVSDFFGSRVYMHY